MLPRLREIDRRFAGSVAVIGVHSGKFSEEQTDAGVRAAVQRNDLAYPVVNDPHHVVWDRYAVRAWPTMVLVDAEGRAVARHEGEIAGDRLAAWLSDLIAAAPPAPGWSPPPREPLAFGGGALRFPAGVWADEGTGTVVVADTGNHRLLVLEPGGGVRAVVGTGAAGFVDGAGGSARFRAPRGMSLLPDGRTLAVADTANHALRAVDLETLRVTTLAGTGGRAAWHARGGPGRSVALASPWDVAWFAGAVWIAMAGLHQLWRYEPDTGLAAPAAGTGAEALHDGPLATATFAQPSGVAPLDEALFVLDAEASAVRRVDPRADRVRRLIGRGLFVFGDVDGVGDAARLQHPLGVAAEPAGSASTIWIADAYNHAIRVLDPATRRLDTLTGGGPALADGPLAAARFNEPSAVTTFGSRLLVADTNNHALRAIDLGRGEVETWEVA